MARPGLLAPEVLSECDSSHVMLLVFCVSFLFCIFSALFAHIYFTVVSRLSPALGLVVLALVQQEALFELLRRLPSGDPGALSDAEVVPDNVGTGSKVYSDRVPTSVHIGRQVLVSAYHDRRSPSRRDIPRLYKKITRTQNSKKSEEFRLMRRLLRSFRSGEGCMDPPVRFHDHIQPARPCLTQLRPFTLLQAHNHRYFSALCLPLPILVVINGNRIFFFSLSSSYRGDEIVIFLQPLLVSLPRVYTNRIAYEIQLVLCPSEVDDSEGG